MAISTDKYEVLARYMVENCTRSEIQRTLEGDSSVVVDLITDELMMNDYRGTFLDIIFEDLLTQKKKPLLKTNLQELAEFLASDLSLFMLQYDISKLLKK